MKNLLTAVAALTIASTPLLSAQAGELRGHVSGELGVYNNEATDDGGGTYGFGAVDASVGDHFASGIGWDIDIRYEEYDWESADDTFDQPQATGVIAGHLNMKSDTDTHYGFFLGYGHSWLNKEDSYSMLFGGVEGQTMYGEAIHLFGQLGYGDVTANDGGLSGGFQSGWMLRAGADAFLTDDISLGLEGTLSISQPYIDDLHDGEFYGMTARAETRILQTPLHASIFASHNYYDSTTAGDTLTEQILGVSLSYRFGGVSLRDAAINGASLGTPMIPVYANGWTEQID